MTDIEHLERLAALRANGALSEEEYQMQKARLLESDSTSDVSEIPSPKPNLIGRYIGVGLAVVLIGGLAASKAGILTLVANTSSPMVENTSLAVADAEGASQPAQEKADGTAASRLTNHGPTQAGEGRCSTGQCSYSQDQGREVVGGGINGQLVKVTIRGGASSDDGSTIKWNSRNHDVYVYCSTVLPAVMMKVNDKWQTDILDFATGVPGILESSARLYSSTCHANDRDFPNDAASLGYREIPDGKTQVEITKPNDIFALSAK